MKKLLMLFIVIALILSMIACGDNGGSEDSSSDESSDIADTSTNTDDTSSTDIGTNPTDTSTTPGSDTSDTQSGASDIPKIDFDVDIEDVVKSNNIFNEKNNTFGKEGKVTSFTHIIDIDVSHIAVGGTETITTGGINNVYRITGTSANAQVRIKAPDQDVYIILDNVNLTFKEDEAPIYAEKCKSVTIILAEGSVNTISDTTNNKNKGAIYVKSCNLTIDGSGTLNINANYKSGIFNTKELTINGGVFNITSNYHGVYGEQKLTINGGTFNINSTKSGLKSGDYEDDMAEDDIVVGKIVINGGYIKVNAKSNGISCYGDVEINNGWLDLTAATDGIDAANNVVIKGGTTIIYSTSDGIKTDESVYIQGTANVKIDSKSDGIDAGDLEISTTGTIYIKITATYVNDNVNGIYIRDGSKYYRVNTENFPNKEWYSISGSAKAIKIKNKVIINSGTIGITGAEEAIKAGIIEIKGGTLYISSDEEALNADTVTVYGGNLYILKSYKGIKADDVVINDGVVIVVSVSDSIKAKNVTINSGKTYLFDVIDFSGEFKINGGDFIMLATKKKPTEPTEISNKYISASIEKSSMYTYGKFIKINDTVIKLPKDYSEKITVFATFANMEDGDCKIEVGTYTGGIIYPLIYQNGSFTPEGSQTVHTK